MRNMKLILFSTLSLLLICFIAVVFIDMKVYGKITSLSLSDFKQFLPVLILLPLSHFIWGRYITHNFEADKFNNEKWNGVVKKYNVKELLNDDTRKVYKIPFYKFLFPSKIIIETIESKIIITAPYRIIYEYKRNN